MGFEGRVACLRRWNFWCGFGVGVSDEGLVVVAVEVVEEVVGVERTAEVI